MVRPAAYVAPAVAQFVWEFPWFCSVPARPKKAAGELFKLDPMNRLSDS